MKKVKISVDNDGQTLNLCNKAEGTQEKKIEDILQYMKENQITISNLASSDPDILDFSVINRDNVWNITEDYLDQIASASSSEEEDDIDEEPDEEDFDDAWSLYYDRIEAVTDKAMETLRGSLGVVSTQRKKKEMIRDAVKRAAEALGIADEK